jgi:NAD(P)-dependent dehydrogenase (short-subunit alcohol dehydrogenase family)
MSARDDSAERTRKRTKNENDFPRRPLILLTGASQGIGAAIAQTFARELRGRVRLALVARNEKNLAAVARACAKSGATVATFGCDVSDAAAVEAMAAAVAKRFGVVDVLINNAGKFAGGLLAETSVEQFDAMIAANLRSVFLVTRAFVPAMLKRGRGDIFNMSSIAGLQAYPGGGAYGAAKFGVTGLSKVMREEWKDEGIRVCCVYPGATVSPSWAGAGVPDERLMPAEDVARAFFEIYRLSRRTVVEEIVLRSQRGDL